MRKLIAFEQISLDGYFSDVHGDMSWAHKDKNDTEWNAYVGGNASGGGVLLLGRITYEMMVKYWPTPAAVQNDPKVAAGMNALPKVVFSRTLKDVSWSNTTLVKDDLVGTVRRMKNEPGEDLVILGSGSITSQLAQEGLIDEYQLVVNPIVLGEGKPLFDGIDDKLMLKLASTRSFGNGNVVLNYERAA